MSDLFAKLDAAIRDCFSVDNASLPDYYRNNKSSHTSLADIEKKVLRKEAKTKEKEAKAKAKADHARRVSNYAKQAVGVNAESIVELDYDVNDDKLYHNQLRFVAKMVLASKYDPKISEKMDEHLE